MDCASLETEALDGLDLLSIDPRRNDAASIYLIDFRNGSFQVGLAHEAFDVRDEDVQTADDVDAFLKPAIEGRLRMLIGSRRAVLQVREDPGYVDLGGNGRGLRSLLLAPGWRRRAQVVSFAAYRSAQASAQ